METVDLDEEVSDTLDGEGEGAKILSDAEVAKVYAGGVWLPASEKICEFFRDEEVRDQSKLTAVPIKMSDFTRFAFRLPSGAGGEFAPFSFIGRRHMLQIYDTQAKKILLICARQTEKSTSLGNKSIARSCLVPGHKTLYVSPSALQSKTFSMDRIKDPIETSDILRGYTTRNLSQNVFQKQFVNRSQIMLRYAFLNADRVRGTTPWSIILDEFQDFLSDTIPVIEQSSSHAPERHRTFMYAGTPKGADNPIEFHWSGTTRMGKPMSTMCEWVVPCEGCNFWNILGEKNIGKHSLICEKCGKRIYPQHERAQWAAANNEGEYEGYRINQLMVPWRSWKDILADYGKYTRDRFYNEVLGISFDSGIRPITAQELRDNCRSDITMSELALERYRKQLLSDGAEVYAGIDWGADGSSYTVLTLATYVNNKFRIFYIHRFDGPDLDPDVQVQKIIAICRAYRVKVIGADYGAGFVQNKQLIHALGPIVQQYQYVARMRAKIAREPKNRRWIVSRSEVMSDVFSALKRKNVFELPRWEEFAMPYGQDIRNIFTEYNQKLRMIQYQHRPDRPDDSFHSITFCFLGSMTMPGRARPDIIIPRRELHPYPILSEGDGYQQG